MELFTMGVGNYSEKDVREGARAFTGWALRQPRRSRLNPDKHDDGAEDVPRQNGQLRRRGCAEDHLRAAGDGGIPGREDLSLSGAGRPVPGPETETGRDPARQSITEIKPLLTVIFTFEGFLQPGAATAAHIKGPVEHMVAMMKHLGVDAVPGVPDFNQSTIAMGQHLLNPPSVAGWAGGKAWITPGLLIARGNVARDVSDPRHDRLQGLEFLRRQRRHPRPPVARRLRRRRGHAPSTIRRR